MQLTAESWLQMGMKTGWLKEAAASDSQSDSAGQQWLYQFTQSVSSISSVVTANLSALDRIPTKNQFVANLQNQLRQIQGEVTKLQNLGASFNEVTSTLKANQAGANPTETLNAPLGAAPAIPTM